MRSGLRAVAKTCGGRRRRQPTGPKSLPLGQDTGHAKRAPLDGQQLPPAQWTDGPRTTPTKRAPGAPA